MYYFILYLILAVYGVLFCVLYVKYEIAVFVGVLIMFPLFSYILSVISCLFVKVTCAGEDVQLKRGEEVKVEIHIRNRGIFPITNGVLRYSIGYQVADKPLKKKIKFKARARGESVQSICLTGDYCGTVQLRVYRMTVRDYFYVFPFIKKLNVICQQIIFPDIQEIPMEAVSAASFYNDEYEEFYEEHPGNDPSEVFDIRNYREGDKLQRIHWKLSSKRDQIMVKEYSDPIVINSAIICDNALCCMKSERVEKWSELLEKTVQASYSLLMQEVIHYVYWFDSELLTGIKKEIRSEQDFVSFVSELLQAKPNLNVNGYISYLLHSESVCNYANLFYAGSCNKEQFEQSGLELKVVE